VSVTFAYRSHYEGPTLVHLKRFRDATVLDWFRSHWRAIADEEAAVNWPEATFGTRVYGFWSLPLAIARHDLAPPRSAGELEKLLQRHLYVEGEILFSPHCVQVLTDDDDLQMAYYFFDDDFLAKHRDRAAFLLHKEWELPVRHARKGLVPKAKTERLLPEGKGEGVTYLTFFAYYDSENLGHIGPPVRLDGVRLPGLCRHLARATPQEKWPFELRLLRSQLFEGGKGREETGFLRALADNPDDEATWGVYSDWLQERGELPAGAEILRRALAGVSRLPAYEIYTASARGFGLGPVPKAREELAALSAQLKRAGTHEPGKSVIQVSEHLAQLGLHTADWGRRQLFQRWLFFDDLWAAANPALAKAILRHASRWDVLSGR
jgi:uncharacterized protein (TIGR02996 family)